MLGFATRSKSWTPNQPVLRARVLQREREGFSFTGFDRDAFEPVELPHRQRCSTVSLMDVDLCHSFTSYGVCACYIHFTSVVSQTCIVKTRLHSCPGRILMGLLNKSHGLWILEPNIT
jgi:hypothetical protein